MVVIPSDMYTLISNNKSQELAELKKKVKYVTKKNDFLIYSKICFNKENKKNILLKV